MARGVNKVILVGTLGADPDTRYTPSNAAVTNLSIATNESWKDKQSGEQKEKTESQQNISERDLRYILRVRFRLENGKIKKEKIDGQLK